MAPSTCRIEGCASTVHGLGLCGAHHQRVLRGADLSKPKRIIGNDAARFWSKVDKSGNCWVWTGNAANGYGIIRVAGRYEYAHRYSMILVHGSVPAGADVLHSCDNPPCVNPSHLSFGTAADNLRDAAAKGRTASGLRNGSAKLSPAQKAEIAARYAAGGVTQARLAAEFGVCQPLVGRIARGKA